MMKKALVCVLAIIAVALLAGMSMDNTLEAEVSDMLPANAETYAFWLHDDGDFRINQDSGTFNLGDLSTVVAHDELSGLDADDHDTGANAYLTDGRHDVADTHVSGFNITLPIEGDVNNKTTLGAHVSDAEMHYPRPAQTLTVAKANGQYGTIAAALAVANANANITTPYEVAIYPGVYDENDLLVGDYVSLRSVVSRQGIISSNSANFIVKADGINYFSGLLLINTGAGGSMQISGSIGGEIFIENSRLQASSSGGSALDFNGKTHTVRIFNNSELSSSAAPAIASKTAANSYLVMRNSAIFYMGTNAPNPAVVDIDDGFASTPDEFTDCQFWATGFTGGTTPSSFFDFDASLASVRNCRFRLKSAAGLTFNAMLAQSGTVTVQACLFEWTATAGTPFDLNAAATATINHAATVYDVAKTTGAGTIQPLTEGAALFDAVTLTGSLSMSAADSPLLDLTPSGTGDTDVVSIVPSGALAGANTWKGFYVDGAALDPAAGGATVFGGHLDLSDVDQANDPDLCGLLINLPPSATTANEFHAIKLTGNGNELVLLNKDYLIDLTATSGVPLAAIFSDSATDTIENAAVFKHITSGDMVDGFGASFCFHVEDDASGDTLLATISAERTDGTDNSGKMRFSVAQSGTEYDLITLGDGTGLVTFPQAEDASPGQGPVRFGTAATGMDVTDDGLGAVLNCSGGDPVWIGESVAIKLGDAGGTEEFQILDSGNAVVFNVDSNGALFLSQNIFRDGDLDTRISLLNNRMFFETGGAENLNITQTEVVANEDGGDVDFRVEWNGGADALKINGDDGLSTFGGLIAFLTSSGFQFSSVYAHSAADTIVSAAQNDWDQIVAFDTNGAEQGTPTADHTNDHITVGDSFSLVFFTWSGSGPNQAHDWDFEIARNNRAIQDTNISIHVTTPSTQKSMSICGVGILATTAGDTIEVWTQRTTAGNNVDLETDNVAIVVVTIGG